MYMDYSKLWKLLLEKNLSKTDLLTLTGISSRVMAKLSQNETVTTETLGRICTALHCDVSDIVECAAKETRTLYEAYRREGTCTEEDSFCKTVRFSFGGENYAVCLLRETADRRTHIGCEEDGTVHFQKVSPEGDILHTSVFRFSRMPEETGILLVKGNPASLSGPEESSGILTMTEAAFKVFVAKNPSLK